VWTTTQNFTFLFSDFAIFIAVAVRSSSSWWKVWVAVAGIVVPVSASRRIVVLVVPRRHFLNNIDVLVVPNAGRSL